MTKTRKIYGAKRTRRSLAVRGKGSVSRLNKQSTSQTTAEALGPRPLSLVGVRMTLRISNEDGSISILEFDGGTNGFITIFNCSRSAKNKFGYRIIYFDRIDGLLPQALAWVPQSTVALASFRGMKNLKEKIPHVEILLQVHDSVLFQIPKTDLPSDTDILSALEAPIPYSPPLVIPWKLAKSEKSWGDCK